MQINPTRLVTYKITSVKKTQTQNMFHSYQEKTLENTWDSFNIVGVPSQIDLDVGLGDRRVCLKFHEVILLRHFLAQVPIPAQEFLGGK